MVRKNWRSRKIENASPSQAGMISGQSDPTNWKPIAFPSFAHIT